MFAALADDRRKNGNAFLALVDEPSKLVPCVHPRYMRGGWALFRNGQKIAERIRPENRHCAEIGSERIAVARLQLFDEVLHVLADEPLRRVFYCAMRCW